MLPCLCSLFQFEYEPKSSESHVSVSVVVVMLVKWVEADSVEVLMVELHDEFMTMTLGTDEEFLALVVAALLFILLVFAVLK